MFIVSSLEKEMVSGKRVIDVGSLDYTLILRTFIESWGHPAEYVGVDIFKGPGVDLICAAENVKQQFGENSFDTVFATELLEHVKDWRIVVSNMKAICRPGGLLIITTRSKGFRYHACPHDAWRFELEDMERVFSDFEILGLQKDNYEPGVFVMARKPGDFTENDLTGYEIYNIIVDKRVGQTTDKDFHTLRYLCLFLTDKLYKTCELLTKCVGRVSSFQPHGR